MAETDAEATTPAPTEVEGVAEDAAAVALITGAFAVAETGDAAAGVADAVGVACVACAEAAGAALGAAQNVHSIQDSQQITNIDLVAQLNLQLLQHTSV